MFKSALSSLLKETKPVFLVDAVKIAQPSAWAAYRDEVRNATGARVIFNLRQDSVLLGRTSLSFDRYFLTEFPSGEAAGEFLSRPTTLQLRGEAFTPGGFLMYTQSATLFTAQDTTWVGEFETQNEYPGLCAEDSPFLHDPSGTSNPDAWRALAYRPTKHLYAMNYLKRDCCKDMYADYSSNFKHLPHTYGMRYAHVSLAPDPKNSVLLGESHEYDLVCVAYFPTSKAFLATWSDPHVKKGFDKQRRNMVNSGFEHFWIRTILAEE